MNDSPTSNVFSENLNSEFKVILPNAEPLTLRLSEVNDRSSAKLEQFSLLFYGPQTPRIEQMICRLEHPKIGPMDLFLVPIGVDEHGTHYEAVINRFRKPVTA